MSATTPEAVYAALQGAVATYTGLIYGGTILWNEQTPATSRRRSFFIVPQGWVIPTGMVAQVGYKWLEETVLVRLSHVFRGKAQEAARQLAYADALATLQVLDDTAALMLAVGGSVQTIQRIGPVLSDSGDYILTDLRVRLIYQVALPAHVPPP